MLSCRDLSAQELSLGSCVAMVTWLFKLCNGEDPDWWPDGSCRQGAVAYVVLGSFFLPRVDLIPLSFLILLEARSQCVDLDLSAYLFLGV